MASNVYTKNEILQQLASKGYFIDVYTLDTFFAKWKIEPIFEDEQGSEFYDKNVLDTVLSNLFSAKNTQQVNTQDTFRELKPRPQQPQPQPMPQMPPQYNQQPQPMPQMPYPQQNYQQHYNIPPQMPPQYNQQFNYQQSFQPNIPQNVPPPAPKPKTMQINDKQALDVLNDISLSDGTPLINKVKNMSDMDALRGIEEKKPEETYDVLDTLPKKKTKGQKTGILEGALELANQDFNAQIEQGMQDLSDIGFQADNEADFDDMSLLSESVEAQEKFKEYVISELQRKNADFNPNNLPASNEFKLDISERTISMIARTMAKKIAKNINNIFSAEAKNTTQVEAIKEEYKKLEKKAKELEEQNKKLRLLLSENKKYLNSFKPCIFGLYKKVNPETE